MARYRRFLNSLQRSFIALFWAIAGLFVKAAKQIFTSKRHRCWQRDRARQRARFHRWQAAGFVLPTTALILVVLGFVVAALLIRTSTRMEEVILARKTQEIENAASPALDRARSKLEYMFSENESELPAGLPAESRLNGIMQSDRYNLPGETRINLDEDANTVENAWVYSEGDTRIAYSIIFNTPDSDDDNPLEDFSEDAVTNRAKALQVRNSPIFTSSQADRCEVEGGGVRVDEGWFRDPVSRAVFRKNFQINAIALVPQEDGTGELSSVGTIATIEMQQDRSADRGNKWGAWFLTDLEIFPGADMNWNGAMHTEGNLLLGGGDFNSFLISSENSCLFSEEFSELTAKETNNFQGQFGVGQIRDDSYEDDNITIDVHSDNDQGYSSKNINDSNDSINENADNSSPSDIFVDPVILATQDRAIARHRQEANTPPNVDWVRDGDWSTSTFNNRLFNPQNRPKPLVDDIYRADNRLGPKASYGNNKKYIIGEDTSDDGGADLSTKKAGQQTTINELVRNENTVEPTELGWDGYWERRARREGLRVIVSERLQLEDTSLGINPEDIGEDHINRQRITLQDKLGAAQATLFYHHTNTDGDDNIVDFPVAAMASTVHPGTAETLKRSATFEQLSFAADSDLWKDDTFGDDNNEILIDFFTGRGTNGWEFSTQFNFNGSTNSFPSDGSPDDTLSAALNNLANFAGDPKGAFPPTTQDANIHPYPLMVKWGNFSNLRRALDSSVSIADRSTIQSASFMLGMLAYNITYLNAFDYANEDNWGDGSSEKLQELDDELANLGLDASSTSPEAAISALKSNGGSETLLKLARLVATKEQVERDRRRDGNYSCDRDTLDTETGQSTSDNGLELLCPTDIKYPALQYIFPKNDDADDSDTFGEQGDRADDDYITDTDVNGTGTNIYEELKDEEIAEIALMPKAIANWTLPYTTTIPSACPTDARPNCSQHELIKYDGTDYRVAFKDSALFNGREQMSVRVLNMDLDMLRNGSSDYNNGTINGDTWLAAGNTSDTNPKDGGLVYAFREDAVREDAILRPVHDEDDSDTWADCNSAAEIVSCANDATNQQDPPLDSATDISAKSVDFFPDPDRRPYGFRVKNGADLRRDVNDDGTLDTTDSDPAYGLSLISDQPVYIQGDFNLHTDGSNTLEEFTETRENDWSNFYDRGDEGHGKLDTNFATASGDWWRYSEILSDAVTIISNNFCDGSIEDGIVATGFERDKGDATNSNDDDLETLLEELNRGSELEGDVYGCVDQSSHDGVNDDTSYPVTSYLNQNIGQADGFEDPTLWDREVQGDLDSPIQIVADGNNNPRPSYSGSAYQEDYYNFTSDWRDFILTVGEDEQRVNTVMISGLVPSRAQQSFGGLHNFPRFLEDWNQKNLFLAGSLLQLSYSNYATAPFDADRWDPNEGNTISNLDDEAIRYYAPPRRRWGYDVALQFVQPGPVSKRLLIPSVVRNEYYSEPELEDPYVKLLRCATFGDDSEHIDPSVDDNPNSNYCS